MRTVRPRTISKEQWAALKVGDVLVSAAGNERTIIKKNYTSTKSQSPCIYLAPLKNDAKKKPLVYYQSDLCRAYRLKGAPIAAPLMEFKVVITFYVQAKEVGEVLTQVLTQTDRIGVKDLRCEAVKVL